MHQSYTMDSSSFTEECDYDIDSIIEELEHIDGFHINFKEIIQSLLENYPEISNDDFIQCMKVCIDLHQNSLDSLDSTP